MLKEDPTPVLSKLQLCPARAGANLGLSCTHCVLRCVALHAFLKAPSPAKWQKPWQLVLEMSHQTYGRVHATCTENAGEVLYQIILKAGNI